MLLEQDYPAALHEFIFVDDHSTDNTQEVLDSYSHHKGLRILRLDDGLSGKKAAITHGIGHARGGLITTTDADCAPGRSWLKSIGNCYENSQYRMIAGPVAIARPRGWLASFQALELLSLVASGAGAIGMGNPIMCNGANLAYEKEAFGEVNGFAGNEHIPGGDDVFLMEKFKKAFPAGAIGFNADTGGIVYTEASGSIKDFFSQRFRWVAKSPAYRDPFLVFTAIVVLLFNLNLLGALAWMFFAVDAWPVFVAMFILKSIVDLPILLKISRFAGQTHLLRAYLPFQLFYIFFVPLSGVLGNLLSIKWKGRPIPSGT
jgi:cellulose synthase/poly-beta-1,6-N-acetylglucosamine synthase-like glycosyltransferase